MTDRTTANMAAFRGYGRWSTLFIVMVWALMSQWAAAQVPTYLADVGSEASVTRGASRLLHYLPGDMPILVNVQVPPGDGGPARRAAVVDALDRWEQAVPDLLSFLVVAQDGPDVLEVRWEPLVDKVGSYRYRFSVLPDEQYRFRATAIVLDPRASPEDLERYALLQIGHAVGLLGRSPFIGDAMSASPSGVITQRDVATLRALCAVPSGTVLHD